MVAGRQVALLHEAFCRKTVIICLSTYWLYLETVHIEANRQLIKLVPLYFLYILPLIEKVAFLFYSKYLLSMLGEALNSTLDS